MFNKPEIVMMKALILNKIVEYENLKDEDLEDTISFLHEMDNKLSELM